MLRICRFAGLLILLSILTPGGLKPALAQVGPAAAAERERFLSLLLLRQDQAIERVLAQRKVLLQGRLDRLERLTPRNPQQVQQINAIKQQITQRAASVDQQIANPPPSPLRRQLSRQEVALRRQIAQIEARLNRLSQIVTNNPRLARQIERTLALLQGQLQSASVQVASFERLAATPVAPLNAASVFGGGL